MAYVIMVGDNLSEDMIKAGEELTRELENAGISVKASFWFFLPELSRWRLMIASPEVDKLGHRSVYGKVGRILERLSLEKPSLTLNDVTLLETKDQLVALLRKVVKTDKRETSRIRITGNAIKGRFINDALIYRLV